MAKILAVDDMKEMVYFFQVVQRVADRQNSNISILFVSSGQAALDELKDETFDLVMTDLDMPEMSGLELILQIRQAKPEQKVILTSGDLHSYSSAIEVLKKEVGDFPIWPKPFLDIEQLLTEIEKVLSQ